MMNNIFTFLITLFLCLHQVVAHEGDDHSHCEQALLKAPITIHSSGRDEDMLPELEVAAKKLTQLAKELGFATPPHIMSFVPAVQMNVLASLGRHSAPHWVDGENILRNLGSASNILEFVTRGCDACRSYFSDTNSLKHQISIIMHVLGHNDVSSNSNFHKSVYTDSMGYSKKFAEQVQWLYEHYDHDEVSLYVQWLYSLEYMQNFVFAGFDPPNFFKPTTDNITRVEHLGTKNKAEKTYKSNKHPQRPSANILQALVYNLPSNVPTWKVELLDTFEKSRRYYSGNIATKIMNEGWATFSQYLLARHSDYTTDDDIAQFGGLLYGVAFPKLDNPYYLGLQLWWHLWEQFKNKPEMSKLSAKEIDKLFVSRAHEIISTNDDFSFIDVAIDQKWIDKMKFSLVRPVDSKDKIDRSKIAKPPSNDAKLMVALSRHRERIVRYIQRKVASRQLIFPHVLLEDFNWMNNGIIKLRHEMIEDVPLKMDSSFLSLFVLSQLLEKPIALEAQYDVNYIFIVEPTGKVKVHIKDDKAKLDHRNPLGAINQQLTHVGQKIVDE
ncbi:MAG: SpoVR family protein, partial [Bdellovibrionales bacterium]|nr:SpoVR family protein [Bdellovibrionales bacterium]